MKVKNQATKGLSCCLCKTKEGSTVDVLVKNFYKGQQRIPRTKENQDLQPGQEFVDSIKEVFIIQFQSQSTENMEGFEEELVQAQTEEDRRRCELVIPYKEERREREKRHHRTKTKKRNIIH